MTEQTYQELHPDLHADKLLPLLPLLQKLVQWIAQDHFNPSLMKFFAVTSNGAPVTDYPAYLFIYGDFYRRNFDDQALAGVFVKLEWMNDGWTFNPENPNSYLLTESQDQQWNMHHRIEHSGPEGAFSTLMATKQREEETRLAQEQARVAETERTETLRKQRQEEQERQKVVDAREVAEQTARKEAERKRIRKNWENRAKRQKDKQQGLLSEMLAFGRVEYTLKDFDHFVKVTNVFADDMHLHGVDYGEVERVKNFLKGVLETTWRSDRKRSEFSVSYERDVLLRLSVLIQPHEQEFSFCYKIA